MTQHVERMQDRLYHDMILPEETQEIRAKAREFANRIVAPRAYEIATTPESRDSFAWDVFKALAEEDFFKIPYPSEVGGLGLKYPCCATVVTVEELAYASNSIAAVYDVHCILAGHALEYGSDYIKETYLKPMTTAEKIGCFATTEPKASSDLSSRSVQTSAIQEGDIFVVNGQKRFITNACVADFVTALVNVEGQLTMMVIDLKSKGCRVGDPDLKMGNNGQLTSDIYFENVEVPQKNVIREVGKGLHASLGTLTYGRVGIAATGVGMAQAAFDESIAYMKERSAFGKKIGQFQYWQFKMAERATEIEHARNLYSKAALRMDQGIEFPEPEAAGAKYYATELAGTMARDAVQIFGGYGFMKELGHDKSHYKVEQIFRDYKIAEIYEGTNEIQKMILARMIFGRKLVE
ncbi:MAG: acyl-CoA dehydrogenase [Deltaproteobacteria bacterium]|jgi:alkylation response protein AidB-like acyl-CoA dehydrogenase|nr:acyl-CoA dehydrogenase [Deltaproteobacteria bacterium]MBT4268995.1 acyl-CoA dehydrogenase [Deltaproteobacteria bacterium]MBT4637959.1 acyl-CoA dehydrogenase [Deltaproteobacteria bacterium]MBT6501704.1 acyl-CoA dehydrogenase [Deltaproteobacteria bacterium]MBT6616490.1 acyl-CoA dehydrogenase [Deltaproteobacteria bacterium]